jgi:hypothetical protein
MIVYWLGVLVAFIFVRLQLGASKDTSSVIIRGLFSMFSWGVLFVFLMVFLFEKLGNKPPQKN